MQTRKITEGAMLSAIVGVVLFLDRQSVGMFNFALYWIIPTPMIVYIAKYSLKDAIMPMFTICVLALIIALPSTIYYVIMANIIALWYGYGIKKERDNHILLIQSCLVSIASAFLTMFVFAALFGFSIETDIALIQETMTSIVAITGNTQELEPLFELIPAIAIASIALSGIMEGLLIHLITNIVLTRLKFKIKPMKPLFEIKLTRKQGIVGLVLLLLTGYGMQNMNGEAMRNMLVFLYLIILFVFLVNGYLSILTILAYYKKRKYSILLIFVLPFLVVAGVLDSLMNLRVTYTIQRVPRS